MNAKERLTHQLYLDTEIFKHGCKRIADAIEDMIREVAHDGGRLEAIEAASDGELHKTQKSEQAESEDFNNDWTPKIGEKYYIIFQNVEGVWVNTSSPYTWKGDGIDKKFLSNGRIFRTLNHAKFECDRLNAQQSGKPEQLKTQNAVSDILKFISVFDRMCDHHSHHITDENQNKWEVFEKTDVENLVADFFTKYRKEDEDFELVDNAERVNHAEFQEDLEGLFFSIKPHLDAGYLDTAKNFLTKYRKEDTND